MLQLSFKYRLTIYIINYKNNIIKKKSEKESSSGVNYPFENHSGTQSMTP